MEDCGCLLHVSSGAGSTDVPRDSCTVVDLSMVLL